MTEKPLSPGQLDALRRLSSCVIANTIETFGVSLRNTGFTDSRIRCLIGEFPPLVGYAATARIRTADPPMEGRSYYARTDWWNHIQSIPEPRVVVIEDVDSPPGLGAFVGEVHANILRALGCAGLVTFGYSREDTGSRISHSSQESAIDGQLPLVFFFTRGI